MTYYLVCRRQDHLSLAPRRYSKGLSLEHWIFCKQKGSIAPPKTGIRSQWWMQATLWQPFNVVKIKTRRTINFVKGAVCTRFSSSSYATLYSHLGQSESPNWLLRCIAKWDHYQPQWYPSTSSGRLSSWLPHRPLPSAFLVACIFPLVQCGQSRCFLLCHWDDLSCTCTHRGGLGHGEDDTIHLAICWWRVQDGNKDRVKEGRRIVGDGRMWGSLPERQRMTSPMSKGCR